MNEEQYNHYKNKYENFDERFVFDIPLNMIQVDHIKGQVRTNGRNKDHMRELKEQIESRGQEVPVTVTKVAENLFALVAGGHRFGVKTILNSENPDGSHATIKAAYGFEEVNFNTREDRKIFQLNENTPRAQLPCDIADYVETFVGLIRDDHVLGTDLSKVKPEDIKKYIKSKIPNLSDYRAKTIAKKVFKTGIPAGQRKYRNYARKDEAAEVFTKLNSWGLSVSRSGEIDQGYAVYFAEDITAIRQNNLHGAFWMKHNKPNTKVLIVAYCGNVLSKTPDLKKWRRDAIAKVKEINGHAILNGNLVDGIVFLPQILMGKNKEKQDKTWGRIPSVL